MLEKTTALVFVVLGASLSIARADTDPNEAGAPPTSPAESATDNGPDQLVLPKGRLVLDAALEINLSDGAAFKPVSISPDLWYGVDDKLTVGLVHSAQGSTGFISGYGSSLCLTGTDNGCAHVYNNVGLDARYQLKTGSFSWAAEGGLFINSISDPFLFDIKVGALGRWHKDKLSVELHPSIFIGVTNRTMDLAGAGTVNTNRDVLFLPVSGLYEIMPKLALAAQVGVILPFEDTGDVYAIPLSIGAHYSLNESVELFGAISLTAVAGGNAVQTGADGRSLTLGGSYAF